MPHARLGGMASHVQGSLEFVWLIRRSLRRPWSIILAKPGVAGLLATAEARSRIRREIHGMRTLIVCGAETH